MKTPILLLALGLSLSPAIGGHPAKGCATPMAIKTPNKTPNKSPRKSPGKSPRKSPGKSLGGGAAEAVITFYYPGEDHYGWRSATGERLKPWATVAVDPKVIPYGSTVSIPGLGKFRAHDTGGAVKSRLAARRRGWGRALVVDVCVKNRSEMRRLAANFSRNPVTIRWRG